MNAVLIFRSFFFFELSVLGVLDDDGDPMNTAHFVGISSRRDHASIILYIRCRHRHRVIIVIAIAISIALVVTVSRARELGPAQRISSVIVSAARD